MDTLITLRDIELWTQIGVTEEERGSEQRILATVTLSITEEAGESDDLWHTVSYEAVLTEIRALAKKERKTLERFASEIAAASLRFPRVRSVTVTLRKCILPGTKEVSLSLTFPRTSIVAAYIGIGSNVKAEENIRRALLLLRQRFPGLRVSGIYRTSAQEVMHQPDFLNAVAGIATLCTPGELLETLQRIERELGKAPPFRFGPRTIDLDILLYDDQILPNRKKWVTNQKQETGNEPLLIPHVRMHERRFVLEPLCELLPESAVHPVFGIPWRELLRETKEQRCDKLALSV